MLIRPIGVIALANISSLCPTACRPAEERCAPGDQKECTHGNLFTIWIGRLGNSNSPRAMRMHVIRRNRESRAEGPSARLYCPRLPGWVLGAMQNGPSDSGLQWVLFVVIAHG